MSAQNGKDLLIKVDLSGGNTFQTLAGLRATRIGFNAETVDITSLESEEGGVSCWLDPALRVRLYRVLAYLRMQILTSVPDRYFLMRRHLSFRSSFPILALCKVRSADSD